MATKCLDANLIGTLVDQTKYRSMVGALMYLTTSRLDIVHATCYCACYQAKPTKKHLTAVKRIFRYLKNTINMGLWYLKDTCFKLTVFSDSDHVGCLDSRKSTSGGIQFLSGDNHSHLVQSSPAFPYQAHRLRILEVHLASPEQTATVHHGLLPLLDKEFLKKCLCSKQEVSFQDTQTDCIQDTAQKMKLKRLTASIATMTRQTDAEQGRPTFKKLEVKQVEFKLGEDCWEI
ncbi:hypothetical protein Tco_0516235 [Tanacetum coccineum]